MEEESNAPQLVYVPNELIHRIQSLLPAKDAARTCVLSKSWLRAWSTIPTLRFTTCANDDHLTKEEETDYIKLIDRTLLRYLNDNMSIECLHLHLYMHNSSLSSLAEKWLKLCCLRELRIRFVAANIDNIVEINDVPLLRVFHYNAIPEYTFKIDSLGSVRELVLLRDVVDDAFINMVNSKFPFLETLSLTMLECKVKNIDLTCDSLTRLTLDLHGDNQINIQVYASKLLCFTYEGLKMPNLLFSTNTPEHISLILKFYDSSPLDLPFFMNMREALSLSSNFEIEIINLYDRLNIDLDDLRRRVQLGTCNSCRLHNGLV
ncbi:F-box protein-like protein [Tanacetum coccineum]